MRRIAIVVTLVLAACGNGGRVDKNKNLGATPTPTTTVPGATTPPAAPAPPAPVTSAGGGLAQTLSQLKALYPAIQIAALSPAEGPVAGGTQVTITGSGFAASQTVVYFGSVPATSVTVMNSGSLVAKTPPGPPGDVLVLVEVNGAPIALGTYTYK